eukprot:6930041-Alexandrium_andersonii.AAC.1
MDQNWHLWRGNEHVCDLLQHPIQQLRPLLFADLGSARTQQEMSRRATLELGGPIDWRLTNAIQDKVTKGDAVLLRRIHTLATWTQRVLMHMSEVRSVPHERGEDPTMEEGLCPYCKCAQQTWVHLRWSCERFRHVREEVWGDCLPDPAKLPPGMANAALVPELRLGPPGTPWWATPWGVEPPEGEYRWQEPAGGVLLQAAR